MPTIKQLSVFLERRTGSLRGVMETLTEAKINITTMNIDGTPEFNIVRLLVSDPEEGYSLLKKCGFNVCITTTTHVCDSVEMPQSCLLNAKMLNGQLHVSGLTPGRVWSVFNMYGDVVFQSVAESENETITLKEKDLFVVQTDNRTARVSY